MRWQFRRTDDGAGGRLQALRRGVKFWWRCWRNAAALRLSTSVFHDSALDSIVDIEPAMPLRPLRSYLRRGLSSRTRARALQSHFAWLSQNMPPEQIDQLYLGGPSVLVGDGSVVPGLGILLSRAAHLGREGELALHLEWQGTRVMSLAFSVLNAELVVASGEPLELRGLRAVVGSLQGARGADDALRELSTACERLRPSALLITALQGLSVAWSLRAPLCVAAESHVYAGYASRRRRVGIDYDAAWRDGGGERMARHYWLLPETPRLRPDSEVESRRRAQHRRRNALRTGLCAAVRVSAGRLLRAEPQRQSVVR
ncbi:MAG TPA: DUF535 family protein [Burkholderiaceae bacterium]|nr:DUF535 family protein [Burkholderiaceae bacterium]